MSHVPTVEVLPKDKYNERLVANTHPSGWINPVPAPRYNLVVIGGGSAGLVAAVGAAGLGAKVALVERNLLGGDCLNVGCIPSKALIRASRVFNDAVAAELGQPQPEATEAHFAAAMERVRRVRAELSKDDSIWRFKELGIDVFLGDGRFTGPVTVEVGDTVLTFKKALITTGARPMHLPIDGLAEAGYLTNETVFTLTERPKRLGVIGAGPIGSELAQAFRRLGSEVTVFDILPQVLGKEDRDAADIVEKALRREGIELMLEAQIKRISTEGDEKIFHLEHQGQEKTVAVDEILSAVGRIPNIEGLNVERVGVETTKKGIVVNDHLQTTNPNIYAAGDVAMKYQFTHAADAAARLVLQNALFLGRKKLSALTIPWVTYTDPEVAHVGMYPDDAAEAGVEIDTFTVPMAEVHRAVADGDEEGFVKIHVEQGTDKIVGATIVAAHAGEMLNEITLAMVGGLGLKTVATVIHPYPTQAEAIKKAADAYNRTRLTPTVKRMMTGWLTLSRDGWFNRPKAAVAGGAVATAALATLAIVGGKVFRGK